MIRNTKTQQRTDAYKCVHTKFKSKAKRCLLCVLLHTTIICMTHIMRSCLTNLPFILRSPSLPPLLPCKLNPPQTYNSYYVTLKWHENMPTVKIRNRFRFQEIGLVTKYLCTWGIGTPNAWRSLWNTRISRKWQKNTKRKFLFGIVKAWLETYYRWHFDMQTSKLCDCDYDHLKSVPFLASSIFGTEKWNYWGDFWWFKVPKSFHILIRMKRLQCIFRSFFTSSERKTIRLENVRTPNWNSFDIGI